MKFGLKISLLIGSIITLNSCIKDDNFDEVPKIEFLEFIVFSTDGSSVDSAIYKFSFQDGDGDLGSLDSTDFNCFLTYQEQNTDTVIEFPAIAVREYSLPNLTPNAKDLNIEGQISLIIKPAPIYNIFTDSAYRYSCFIRDRAGNESNIVYAPWSSK